jgi:hypothetical protein
MIRLASITAAIFFTAYTYGIRGERQAQACCTRGDEVARRPRLRNPTAKRRTRRSLNGEKKIVGVLTQWLVDSRIGYVPV